MTKRNRQSLFVLICLAAISVVACHKSTTAETKSETQIDTCQILTNDEIEQVQGSPVTATQPSSVSNEGVVSTQCFYSTKEMDRSVSFAVTQKKVGSASKNSVRDYWRKMFDAYDAGEKEREGDREKRESLREQSRKGGEEEKGPPPTKVTGLGDEAFWFVSPVGGVLYVLKKNAFVRISVGGPDTEQAKLDKSKLLAIKALERL
jgi:hypothetical protein